MPEPFLLEARDLPQAWKILVPEYHSVRYSPVVIDIKKWESKYAQAIAKISAQRATNRIQNYIIPEEVIRVRQRLLSRDSAAIRFGKKKDGHGYHGERGDFCLVGGTIEHRSLTLFYRSLELIGGLGYDLVLIERLGELLAIDWQKIRIMANSAHVFALKKNSNEKLYPKLREVFSK
jgi:hypothetical protein